MNILLKRTLLLSIALVFLSMSNSYAQSESEKIDKLVEQKRAFNKKNKNNSGFKIQIYNGNEAQALKTQREFDAIYPNFKSLIVYKSPEWKTQVGPFKTRLEADRTLLTIKQDYRGAIVIEEKN